MQLSLNFSNLLFTLFEFFCEESGERGFVPGLCDWLNGHTVALQSL